MDPEIAIVMCGPLAGISGGDTHALRFVDRWERDHPGSIRLLAPPDVARHVPQGAAGTLVALRTPLDRWVRNLAVYALVVVARTVLALVRMPRGTRIAVASSHFFHDVVPAVVARLSRRSRVAVFIYHLVADMDRPAGLRSALSLSAERFSLALLRRWADVVFVDNEDVAESVRRRGFAPERVLVTANAFDPLVELPPRSRPEPPVLAFCGRFVEEKGIWDVIDLARALAQSGSPAQIEMAGDGPLRAAFAERLRAERIENVRLLGFVSEAGKWALLRRACLFLAPSREEGWGIAVGEALTAGTPVVAYDLPAYKYLGDAIDRVPAGDVRAFVAAVQHLLGDGAALQARMRALDGAAGRLPRWDAILSSEFAALRERCLAAA